MFQSALIDVSSKNPGQNSNTSMYNSSTLEEKSSTTSFSMEMRPEFGESWNGLSTAASNPYMGFTNYGNEYQNFAPNRFNIYSVPIEDPSEEIKREFLRKLRASNS